MPDKKLTDKEIVKALECCVKAKTNDDCRKLKCPFFDNAIDMCGVVNSEQVLFANALDLINRLQAEDKEWKRLVEVGELQYLKQKGEAEDLEKKLKRQIQKNRLIRKQAKAEAYKEFAERVRNCSYPICKPNGDWVEVIKKTDMHNLLKELVGDK